MDGDVEAEPPTNFLNDNSSSNSDISFWDTSNVEDMDGMFVLATAFNQDISNWNTSKVSSTLGMFAGAASFNQILEWNTSQLYMGMFWCITSIKYWSWILKYKE